jgi:hypothetical protein
MRIYLAMPFMQAQCCLLQDSGKLRPTSIPIGGLDPLRQEQHLGTAAYSLFLQFQYSTLNERLMALVK